MPERRNRFPVYTVPSQAEAEAGTSTTKRTWTALRISQMIAALGGGGGLSNLIEDLSPQLGANLDRNGFDIVGADDLDLLTFTEVALAVNSINIENAIAGVAPVIQPVGPAGGIPLRLRSKGGGFIIFTDGSNLELLRLVRVAAAINEVTINNATIGNAPSAEATGGDPNIHFNIITKGTGVLQANGVAVLLNLVEDTTPQLGGDLDLNGKNIDFPTTANISDCLDEDDMSSDSATMLATQQSIKAYVNAQDIGKQTIWVPATAMIPTVSNGCASLVSIETTDTRPDLNVLDFRAATGDEHAQFTVAFPKSWNAGTITFKVFWTSIATDTDGVAWGLQGVATADGDTIDVDYGTAVVVPDDNQSAAEDCLITAESGAVTIAGSPAAGELSHFRVFRDISNGNDDMTEDARLIGIQVFFTTNAADDT